MNVYPFEGPLGRIASPDFGGKHLPTLAVEINKLQCGDHPIIAVAHRCRWISPNNWSQQSMLFVGLAPADDFVHLRLTIGSQIVWDGDGFAASLYWHFINWDRAKGPITIQINDRVYVIESVLQTTDMNCILFHPKPRVEAVEATDPIAA